jgi:hypothetical protein
MSVILVTLPGSPKESDAAKKKDAETDERLESIVRGDVLTEIVMSYCDRDGLRPLL